MTDEKTTVGLVPREGESKVTLVHDVPDADRQRENAARERAENTKVAKNQKRLKLLQVRQQALRRLKKLAQAQSKAQLELSKAGKAFAEKLSEELPDGVESILAGWKALGYTAHASIAYTRTAYVDSAVQTDVTLTIYKIKQSDVGEGENRPYSYSTKDETYGSENLSLAADEAIKEAWAAVQECDKQVRHNNEILNKAQENLDMLEEMGEIAEATAIRSGLSDDRLKQVEELESVFDKFLDNELDDGGKLLEAAQG